MRQLAKSLVTEQQSQPTPRKAPQTPSRNVTRTPAGTAKRTPRGGTGTVATPHTARAVKQLQLAVRRSGGVNRSIRKHTEIRRESQRDVLRGLSNGKLLPFYVADCSVGKTTEYEDYCCKR